ncbi:MAG: ABC transporter ATP-binding protein [Ignavibacteriales bacterium]|nr:ABC transporter ATP-binding protein [Ignavibacteriales bacterium]
MNNYFLTGENITKTFGRRIVFKNVNFSYSTNGIWGIAGKNGSGKSTLVKIIAGIISPTKGKITHKVNEKEIESEAMHDYIGFVSPYLVLYDEFTAQENLEYSAKIRGINFNKEKVDSLLNEFLLYDRRNDLLKGYSSGMKQRIKFIFALMHSPPLLVLDEPTSNLDIPGKESVYKIIKAESETSIVIIASNEESDLALCNDKIQLEDYK